MSVFLLCFAVCLHPQEKLFLSLPSGKNVPLELGHAETALPIKRRLLLWLFLICSAGTPRLLPLAALLVAHPISPSRSPLLAAHPISPLRSPLLVVLLVALPTSPLRLPLLAVHPTSLLRSPLLAVLLAALPTSNSFYMFLSFPTGFGSSGIFSKPLRFFI
jgi:hypothetical protein